MFELFNAVNVPYFAIELSTFENRLRKALSYQIVVVGGLDEITKIVGVGTCAEDEGQQHDAYETEL
jgi:hypothetical protein